MNFEIDNVDLKFGSKDILSGIYLKAEEGKITGILGPNGSGKSSLLKIFFGSLQPQNKLIRINSKPVLKPLYTSGLVKYLPQHSLIPGNLKIKKAFDFYKIGWKEFLDHFPKFEKYASANMHQLSGGEKRVAEIYLSLKSPAKLLLMDEPFSHVAPLYLEQLTAIIRSEKSGKAIVMTDHMYRHITELADDLYLIKNGCSRKIQHLKELEEYHYLNPGTL
ncbi:ABC transporter ATP-binding protein [Salinimicrobium marinum]|uniref:ABC transporter ATP-binding protein n=1 Tax=Salinimicrobium marinum TaxID=680283 RepID=A0A918VV06_9FLAO|nr:ABC transporter ATP-binding protein [Salinimicrobium marinum]GHA28131.1 ABC transporter ATP-binding protein [Salinimicrobium marinum]